MANSYMYMKCTMCKDKIMIAKFLSREWDEKVSKEKLNEFFEKHNHVDDPRVKNKDEYYKYGGKHFKLVIEQ
ncbi:MAG: hypothetical protein PHX51_07100 [Clostridia bacterium]|nr:hypothetical protein [Clostridia bacterium]